MLKAHLIEWNRRATKLEPLSSFQAHLEPRSVTMFHSDELRGTSPREVLI